MIVALALVGLTVLTVWAAPRVLTRGGWQVRHPRLALAAWASAVGFGAASIVASVVISVALATGAAGSPSGAETIAATVAGWIALLGAGGLVAVALTRNESLSADELDERDSVFSTPHRVVAVDGGVELILTAHAHPFACAVPGSPAAVVVSEGLRELLSPAQLAAVVEHEREHLRGRHHLAARLADLNAACLPRVRGARALHRTTRLLLELVADDAAARRAGGAHLANALVALAEVDDDAALALRARRLDGRRVHRRGVTSSAAALELARARVV